MHEEKSITKLDQFVGQKIQIVAFGTSYVGTLQKVDYEDGYLILTDGKDVVTIQLERVDSFMGLD